MIRKILFIAGLATLSLAAHAQDYVITKYGVKNGDSTKLNTKAIQAVIDRAAKKGGTVVIPKGTFLSGALFFKPKTKLRLESGAVLKGSDNIANYPLIPSRMEGRSQNYYAALVNAYKVPGFSITGPGTINGNGAKFWSYFWFYRDSMKRVGKEATNLEVHRPRLVFIWGSNNVKIKNVKLHNSGFWTTHLYQSNNVVIEDCDIRSPYKPVPAPSTDGVDIDVCKNVTVRNCYISVNDDGVCIKGGKGPTAHKLPENGIVENVLVEGCTFGESHAALTFGSESIHARNVVMRNCKINSTTPLFRFKMRPDTYQHFEQITVENVTGKAGVIFEIAPWKQFFDLGGSTEKPFGTVNDITIRNIKIECDQVAHIQGNPNDKVSGITFSNIEATAKKPGIKNVYEGVKLENVVINGQPYTLK
ncbi:glycosyl hydrolase family 28 protein [uncultured Mucilaginibacter sp.]|uniref:glycoside hydrolase family 28 protein n=1 Tax=uncultured Mucilaginibacter sp. TaxID=797541 RepID=UPI0025D23A12|nr:glycosyl hydrolase family 28 protein [uncultured Mucilaginibacter sp.]